MANIQDLIKLGRTWKGTLSSFGVISTLVGSIFYGMTWLDANYASAETVQVLQTKQVSFEQKLEDMNKADQISRLETMIEETGDKIYELNRRIKADGVNARESDKKHLDKLERRLERYERDLNRLQ